MKITLKWLEKQDACDPAIQIYRAQSPRINDPLVWLDRLINGHAIFVLTDEEKLLQWGNWLIVRLLAHEGRVAYAVYAAQQVLHHYEAEFPDDDRPRKAIEAAEAYLADPSDDTQAAATAAWAAAGTAEAAAGSAEAAESAASASSASWAARSAVRSASSAAWAAQSASSAARAAARAAESAASAAEYSKTLKTILGYGVQLLKNEN